MIVNRKRKVTWRAGVPYVTVGNLFRPVGTLLGDANSNTKTAKNDTNKYDTVSLSLAAHILSGIGNLCGHETKGCSIACLFSKGKGYLDPVHAARVRRSVLFFCNREYFMNQLVHELQRKLSALSRRQLVGRLNMFSDKWFETIKVKSLGGASIIDYFSEIQFMDYTKWAQRAGLVRPNYWVTFSRSESNHTDCLNVLRSGGNVAVVYDDGYTTGARNLHGSGPLRMPNRWHGFRTISGDKHDMRWKDLRPRVVMLRLKARTLQDRYDALKSGFAIKGVE